MTKQTAKLWNRQKNFVKVAHIAFGSYFRKKTTTHFHVLQAASGKASYENCFQLKNNLGTCDFFARRPILFELT